MTFSSNRHLALPYCLSMIPRGGPEGMLFRKPVSTPDQVRGRLFRDASLGDDMKALLCPRVGGPDALEMGNVADPVAGPDEAVVRVEAAALNFFDTLIIAGKYQTRPTLPFSPAAEFAGTVESIGAEVRGFAPGDRVAANIGYGAARPRIPGPAGAPGQIPAGPPGPRARRPLVH